MPFVPLTPEEKEKYKPPCQDLQHNPPTNCYFLTEVMKWVCPSCGKETIVYPTNMVWRYNQWTDCGSMSDGTGVITR